MEWSGWLDTVERQLHSGDDPRGHVLAGQIRDRVLHKAYLKKGDLVADLGCGKGFLTLEAARLVGGQGRVTGIDASEEALEKARGEAVARGLSNLVFIQGDLTSLPLETGSIGVVLARSVFAYIAERREAFREAWRILEPGGRISLFEPVIKDETYQLDWGEAEAAFRKMRLVLQMHHPAFRYSIKDLKDDLESVGFEGLESFVWHADTTRVYNDAQEAAADLGELLPGELAPLAYWRKYGIKDEEIEQVAERLLSESSRPGYRNSLPCIYFWGVKAPLGGKTA
jgi:ubiquinone/menaquinone biosynthesis C-methylase UbiE